MPLEKPAPGSPGIPARWTSGFGIHFADLDTARLPAAGAVVFTLYWPGDDRWQGADYSLAVDAQLQDASPVSRSCPAAAVNDAEVTS
ncbi:MAG TPA: hypothetical protein VE085_08175 [Burkholderiales bacterium]|nr:hypothetical protein [Burkholderiales bacterium]